jgi:plasmid stabilization system protein ParE
VKLAWSNLAREDLRELWRFSVEHWGRKVAGRYLEDVRDAAKQAAIEPRRARPLKGPYRIRRVRSGYLIVHLDPAHDRLTVARVLHTAMDIERHLP